MRFAYSRARQTLLAVLAAMMVGLGLFIVWFSFDLMDSMPDTSGMNRATKRMARRANSLSILIALAGGVLAASAVKPLQMVYQSKNQYVEIDADGLTYEGQNGGRRVQWNQVKRAGVDDFTGSLEIKVPNDIIVVPKEFEDWEQLVAQVQKYSPKTV